MQQARDRRPDALGDLQRVPDEIVCSIIGLLPPRTVGTLACVSSVFYILCNEEDLWMHLCLDQYCGRFLQFKGSWRQTALSILGYIKEGTRVFMKPPMYFDGFSSLFLYRRWYRCHVSLDGFGLDNGAIDRRANLSPTDFQATYDGKKPVMLTDLTKDWPAQQTWNLNQMVDRYGDVAFKVSQSHGKKIRMNLKDYALYMAQQHDEEPLYIFDAKFGELAPGLLEDYSVPSLFAEDLLEVLDKPSRPPFRWIVAGPARSGASWHVDPALTSAWNSLLSGRKRWALYPPGRVPPAVVVHVDEDNGSVNFDAPTSLQWWLDIYPTLQDNEKPLECTQLPGETIYVPSGWWHCVLNIDASIAVTQNFVNKMNLELVCLDMAPGYHHRGVARAGRLAIEEGPLRCRMKGLPSKQAVHASSLVPDWRSMTIPKKADKVAVVQGENAVDACGGHDFLVGKEKVTGSGDVKKAEYPEENYLVLDVDALASHRENHLSHFLSSTSKSGYLDRTELRDWLRRLWRCRPDLHQRLWKCASLALDANTWLRRVTCICEAYGLPVPMEEEQLPVGDGSNPVYLIKDYVVKLMVEDGGSIAAVDCLCSELQFYAQLLKSGSMLRHTVPAVIASGILSPKDNQNYDVVSWDGTVECPLVTKAGPVGKKRQRNSVEVDRSSCRTRWSESHLGMDFISDDEYVKINSGASNSIMTNDKRRNETNEDPILWPFLVTKRCEGTNLAQSFDKMTKEDFLALATFLGQQLRLLHSLPLPPHTSRTWVHKASRALNKEISCVTHPSGDKGGKQADVLTSLPYWARGSGDKDQYTGISGVMFAPGSPNGRRDNTKKWSCKVPIQWQCFVGILRELRTNAKERFRDWESLPLHLFHQLDAYLPKDPVVLIAVNQVCDGVAEIGRPPVWLHMDIMTDNIQMVSFSHNKSLMESVDGNTVTCGNGQRTKHTISPCMEITQHAVADTRDCSQNSTEMCGRRVMQPGYILDFGDVVHGDPLYEFVPLYFSVFKGDPNLLKYCLRSYGLPLSTPVPESKESGGNMSRVRAGRDCTRLSYRAMCYCLLHEQDAVGAMLKLRKDLRKAASLEDIEEEVWGVLNELEGENHHESQ